MLEVTVPPQLRLEVNPDHARVGDLVVLTPTGPDADRSVSGVASMLQQDRAGQWIDLFYLVSNAQRWLVVDETTARAPAFPAIGLMGPVTVVVPPVEPGEYRIRRDFSIRREEGQRAIRIHGYADLFVVS